MFPSHDAVPDGLDIELIGTARWQSVHNRMQQNVLSLWRDPSGNSYYCLELWSYRSAPFWTDTRMSDLVACTFSEFETLGSLLMESNPEAMPDLVFKFSELSFLWGYLDGIEEAIRQRSGQ